eukprot:RCo033366
MVCTGAFLIILSSDSLSRTLRFFCLFFFSAEDVPFRWSNLMHSSLIPGIVGYGSTPTIPWAVCISLYATLIPCQHVVDSLKWKTDEFTHGSIFFVPSLDVAMMWWLCEKFRIALGFLASCALLLGVMA